MSTILLVEDSPTQLLQMRMLLESGAHVVRCAGDGCEALEHLASGFCELVVTDLEMPMMNGLELVQQMRNIYPHIPAILVTARGSEHLAAEALRKGAAGYVPKANLEDLLLTTVDDVLGLIRTEQSYAKLIECMTENRFVFELPNQPDMFMPAIDLTLQMASGIDVLDDTDRPRVAMAIKQALENAMYRGNLQLTREQWRSDASNDAPNQQQIALVTERLSNAPYKDRTICYDARVMKEMLRVAIRDQGPGYDVKLIMKPDEPQAFDDEKGRGLVLISTFMDKVSFNESGNEITLIKYRDRESGF
ncbi:MAG: response regulator [Pirellulaceae bacterium]|nr:response regulator [Pirellulaceae bacterium]